MNPGYFTQNRPMDLLEIGLLLKEARKRSRRTQAELAQALGMSRATLSALEGGRCEELGVRKLTALLEAVGLDLVVGPRKARPTLYDLRAERRNERSRA
jgi:HTH-type transcriptional regulator/antitoxin HipB